MAIATLLLAMSQSMWANTPYRNLYVSASSNPTGGGIIYLETSDNDPYLQSVEGSSTALKATVGENGPGNYDCWINVKVNKGYTFLGITTNPDKAVEDYEESDFLGTKDDSKLKDGYDYCYKVNINNPDREGKDDAYDEVKAEADGTGEHPSWAFPESPDHTYYAIFKRLIYDYAYQKIDWDTDKYNYYGQKPNWGGTIGIITCSKEKVDLGDEVTLEATPKPGCRFIEWIDEDDNHYTDNPITVTVDSDTRLIGYFGINPITIGSSGIATYSCAKAIMFESPESDDIKAYGATIGDDGKVHLLDASTCVPSNNGALLIGESKKYNPVPSGLTPEFLSLGAFNGEANTFNKNQLKNTSEEGKVADGNQYVLSNKNGAVGFYKVTSGKTIPQGKAYIEVTGSAKDFIGFSDDDNTTAIANMIEMRMDENQGFNLQGQRVDNNYRGIIVKNGKKYINK